MLATIKDGVAVLSKRRPGLVGACGARHECRVLAPFFIRGGFRVMTREVCVVEPDSVYVKYAIGGAIASGYVPRSPLIYDSCDEAAVEKIVRDALGKDYRILETQVHKAPRKAVMYYRRFKHGEWAYVEGLSGQFRYYHGVESGDGETASLPYLIYEFVSPDEAKLIDDVSRIDYVLMELYHRVSSRAFCANIKLLGGDVVWHKTASTCCRIESVAVGIIVARYGSRVVIARNDPPYRGTPQDWTVEEWEMVVPPRRLRQKYGIPEEDLTAYVSEEIPAEDIV